MGLQEELTETTMQSTQVLKEALPYIQKFHGQTFVIKISGSLAEESQKLQNLAEEIALLHYVGIRVLVVHGGGPQATKLQKALGVSPTIVEGRRVTDAMTLDVAKMVFAGKINVEILSHLRRAGVRAVGLSGVDGNIINAHRRPPQKVKESNTDEVREVDFGFVGDIKNIDPSLPQVLLNNGYIPVISPLGADQEGGVYNINADTVATELAISLEAMKLLLLADVEGVYIEEEGKRRFLSRLSAKEASELIGSGKITGGMIPKIQNALQAVERGVGRVQILSGQIEGTLLNELFTRKGCGTMIEKSQTS
jgi:acetylglutamate kinase